MLTNKVASIDNEAFRGCIGLTSIEIPNSVTNIGNSAFSGCSGLTSIEIPNSVTSIGGSAFSGCYSLESMTLPFVGGSATATTASSSTLFGYIFGSSSYTNSYGVSQYYSSSSYSTYHIPSSLKEVTVTGGYLLYGAFFGCTGLTSIEIPNSVTSIESSAFSGCTGLTSIEIPNSVTSIRERSFYGCNHLTSVTLGNSVTSIGDYVFNGCSSISELTIPASVTSIGAYGINTGSEKLLKVTMLPTIVPTLTNANGIHTYPIIYILAEAYDNYTTAGNWTSHSSQMIPIGAKTDWAVNVTADNSMSSLHATIGEQNLPNVLSLKVKGTINSYDIMIMRNKMERLRHLDLEEASIVANSYEYYTGYCSKDDEIDKYAISANIMTLKLPNTLKIIGDFAFAGCFGLTSIEIPNSVTSINDYAFSGCSRLTSIEIPNSVKSIGTSAFKSCINLTNILLGSSVTSIGKTCFEDCRSLTNIVIPGSVTSIGDNVFSQCWNIRKITMPGIKSAGQLFSTSKDSQNFLYNAEYNIYVPNSLAEITVSRGTAAGFKSFSSLKKVTLEDDVTSIDVNAFLNCRGLTTVVLGDNIKTIGNSAFEFCSSLQSVEIPNSVSSIGSNAFSRCSSLESVEIPTSVTSIGNSAFSACSALKNVTLPEGIKIISEYLFVDCSSLQSVVVPASVTSIDEYAFRRCSGLKNIVVPVSLKNMGEGVFYGCSSLTSCTIPKNSVLTEIPTYTFYGCKALEKMQLPVSVKKIGDYAFQNCSNMTEMKIPSSITSIGANAFSGCTKLNDVYTYTLEPQTINQNTFATYSTATLHVPAVSWYNYYYDTQWSQFLKLSNFDEPYDYVLIQKDYTLRTETSGIISGKPETEIEATGGLIVTGNVEQPLGDVHIKFDVTTNKGASIIAQNNLTADNLYVDIDVKKDYWHFFCFPFDVDLTKIQKEGSYIFRRYDSSMRASNGTGGWRDVEGTTLAAGKGYIFRTNTAGTLSIPVANPDLSGAEKTTVLVKYGDDSTPDEHKNWNFVGNTFLSYYDTNSMSYDAPIVVWDGTTYVAYRPGDDDYKLTPYQAFFVQRPNNVADVTFSPDGRMTGITVEAGGSSNARMRKAARLHSDRQIVNVTISDGANVDKCRVVFNDNQSLDYEMECDAAKFLSSENVPQIYTIDDNGTQYAINERPMFNGVVSLGFVAPHDGEYTFAASRMDVPVYVIDNMTGETFNLADGYTFTAEAGTDNTRFAITAKPETDVDGIKTINADAINSGNAVIYDLSGKRVTKAVKGVYVVEGAKVYVK